MMSIIIIIIAPFIGQNKPFNWYKLQIGSDENDNISNGWYSETRALYASNDKANIRGRNNQKVNIYLCSTNNNDYDNF